MTTPRLFPREAERPEQIRWAVTERNNARRRRDAWGKRYEHMCSLVRALRRPPLETAGEEPNEWEGIEE